MLNRLPLVYPPPLVPLRAIPYCHNNAKVAPPGDVSLDCGRRAEISGTRITLVKILRVVINQQFKENSSTNTSV